MKKDHDNWFNVDRVGLAKILGKRDKGRLVGELVQNALDEPVSAVEINITLIKASPFVELTVTDDSPDGFKDLAHAYTLFAESYKKADPAKRGRFNLGEKLIIALCKSATITTTTGTIEFSEDGRRRVKPRSKRSAGSEFKAMIRMTRAEVDSIKIYLQSVLIPKEVTVKLNGCEIPTRVPLARFQESLETEVVDNLGVLTTRVRKADVELYEPLAGEKATLFELGLPVVETGGRWHINVCQKIPQNLSRDNVRPVYLKRIQTLVLNKMAKDLTTEDVNDTWVQQATSDPNCSEAAIESYLDLRFGKHRASYDPSDKEANKRIQSRGGTVVTGSMLNRQQWENAKKAKAIKPSGQVSPSPKAYSTDPGVPLEDVLPKDQWTDGMRNIASYACFLAQQLMEINIDVKITRGVPFVACYGNKQIVFNLDQLSFQWFEQGPTVEVDTLIIHEFGHEYSSDHLSSEYHEALCKLGAMLKRLALQKPEEMAAFEPPSDC